ncbi:epimerase family protein SDR39U1-like isoform X1 [Dinothrombium tinctorium]|uniref:Epimerase family protein SDR39U1-like isoform X1 n=1 Tax=Dinothrombium tinctorium TaxID=1965070 RepID=A0A443RFH6_9ACAR|nr:epimerase family protein SDR39U1-like isoform X1 [Dinothrombium tinctorium]
MSSRFATVVIGGGTGFIGNRLKNAFAAISSKVVIVSRNATKDRMSWTDISKHGIPENTEVVVNVAGLNVLNPMQRWSSDFKTNVILSRVETTKILADAISKCNSPPKVFITISGVNYYQPDGKEYTEYDRVPVFDFFSRLCKDWEEAGNLPEQIKTRRVIIRSGVVLGNESGMIATMRLPFFAGLGGIVGSGKQFMPWIHVEDLTRMFLFAASNEKVKGVLNGVSPQIITNSEFTKALGKAMNRPTLIPLPEFAVKLVFGNERSDMILKGAKVKPKRVLDLGFEYKYEKIEDACKQLV